MPNGNGTSLGAYHESTKHSPAGVRASPHYLDWANQPRPFKVYPALDPLPLPTELPGSRSFGLDAIAGSPSPAASPLDLAHL
ncbi:MAG: hypothetical protein ACREQL_10060, partial [Candidatus Binatia bacterium]